MSGSFVHLHVHTEYSSLDGAAQHGPLLTEAERLGMSALAMTDHGNMFGAYSFWKAAQGRAKPILGIEAYVAPGDRTVRKPVFWGTPGQREDDVAGAGAYTHMTMLARDAAGLRNLFRLSSEASLSGQYYKPRMDRDLIAEHAAGIIATTGCPSGEVQTRLRLGQYAEAVRAAADYRDIFGAENYYLELMDHGIGVERRVREDLLRLAKELDLSPLATNDSHYVVKDEVRRHDVLLCVSAGKTLADANRFKFDGDGYYLKSAEEMRAIWDSQVPGACDNTVTLADRVESYDEVFAFRDRTPLFPVPDGETQQSWLTRETQEGLERRFPAGVPAEHQARADFELTIIEKMGFPSYFLVVADICDYARRNGIRVGPGRGSATGCLVAYVLGITELDPIEHKLLFERFLNPERVSPPDIDLDFDERGRGRMIEYVTRRWGAGMVAQIITYGRIKTKAALKDAARVLGHPFSTGERLTKALPPAVMGSDIPLKGIFDPSHPRYAEAGEARQLIDNDPDLREVYDTALGLEGLLRNWGVHAAGVILSRDPLIESIPLWRNDKDGAIVTGFAYPQCEDMGLLKMDFLGLRNLTIIDDAVANIKANRDVEVDIDQLPLADDATFELLSRGDTLGVFQLDGAGMRTLLRAMAPRKFEDVSAALALYRPGPMAANAHMDFADRSAGRKPVVPIQPELAEPLADILDETFGLIVYQEQVMAIAQRVAGYSLGRADLLRRAMGKKKPEVLEKEFVGFSAGMRERGYSDNAIKTLWDILLPFSGYAFNKSHTAGYGIVSFWTAYLKANYPAEYMAALLTSVGDDKDKMAVYLAECRSMGIKVLSPDVNASELQFAAVGEGIRFGLGAIRNVGANAVATIVTSRDTKGAFTDFYDYLRKVDAVACNKKTVESLIKAGAFDSLGHSRKGLLAIHADAIDSYLGIKRNEAVGQYDLFGDAFSPDDASGGGGGMVVAPTIPADEWDKTDLLTFEREMLGLYVSDHPLFGVEHVLSAAADMPISALAEEGRVNDGQVVTLAGILSGVQRRITKQGRAWASATLEDLGGAVEVLFFPNTYEVVGQYLADDAIVVVKGRVDRRDDQPRLMAMDLSLPDITAADAVKPVVLALTPARCTPPLVQRLREVLSSHPGSAEVHVKLVNGSRATLLRLGPTRVSPTTALMADLKALLGPAAVTG